MYEDSCSYTNYLDEIIFIKISQSYTKQEFWQPCGWDLKVESTIKNAIPVHILSTSSTQLKTLSLAPTSYISNASLTQILVTHVKNTISPS